MRPLFPNADYFPDGDLATLPPRKEDCWRTRSHSTLFRFPTALCTSIAKELFTATLSVCRDTYF
ncbi:hypothetical protein DPMN_191871 [Dreissena polymorpha]|uniref:Uncharacterized protein n=1 Tax=Dreissena polymorpha TaxID=45954 RepID=A0A9D3Y094_DREPO|nr:hypothetical protein DPMN_191871 [Dreissena polymorpha]